MLSKGAIAILCHCHQPASNDVSDSVLLQQSLRWQPMHLSRQSLKTQAGSGSWKPAFAQRLPRKQRTENRVMVAEVRNLAVSTRKLV
jgi:hypothetical protein